MPGEQALYMELSSNSQKSKSHLAADKFQTFISHPDRTNADICARVYGGHLIRTQKPKVCSGIEALPSELVYQQPDFNVFETDLLYKVVAPDHPHSFNSMYPKELTSVGFLDP